MIHTLGLSVAVHKSLLETVNCKGQTQQLCLMLLQIDTLLTAIYPSM